MTLNTKWLWRTSQWAWWFKLQIRKRGGENREAPIAYRKSFRVWRIAWPAALAGIAPSTRQESPRGVGRTQRTRPSYSAHTRPLLAQPTNRLCMLRTYRQDIGRRRTCITLKTSSNLVKTWRHRRKTTRLLSNLKKTDLKVWEGVPSVGAKSDRHWPMTQQRRRIWTSIS